jgi:hypothetical protein
MLTDQQLERLVQQFDRLKAGMDQLTAATRSLANRPVLGSFTCGAAATTTVTETAVKSGSVIVWIPTNAAAGTLEGAATKLYLSARTAGASFAVTTANGAAAAGTETFVYAVIN